MSEAGAEGARTTTHSRVEREAGESSSWKRAVKSTLFAAQLQIAEGTGIKGFAPRLHAPRAQEIQRTNISFRYL